MKRSLLVLESLIILALVFSGCAPAAKVYVCADGREVASLDMCTARPVEKEEKALPEASAENEPVPTFFKDLTPEVLTLFEKSENANTIQFNYFRSDNPYTKNVYTTSRELLKVDLTQKDTYTKEEPYDMIYIDLAERTASGYCEKAAKETCPDTNRRYDVDFDKYHVTTPYEWIGLVSQGSLTGRGKQIDGRQTKEVSFKTSDGEGMMWVDTFFGVPLEVNFNGVDYKFQNAVINIVKADTLVHKDT